MIMIFLRDIKRKLMSFNKKLNLNIKKNKFINDRKLIYDGPLVSVVMTVYNREKYIKEAIESVLNQSYKNIELIIVNDGSTDNSEKIIKQFEDSRIKYYKKNNTGQLDTFKYAYKRVNGEYVIRVDSDDKIDKDIISLCINEVNSDLEIKFVYFDFYNIDSNSNLLSWNELKDYNSGEEVLEDVFNKFYSVIPDTVFWRTDYIENVDKYYIDENIPFYIGNIMEIKFKHIKLPLYFYRHHNNNYASSLSNLKFVLGGIIKTIEFIINNYDSKYYLNDCSKQNSYILIAKRYYKEALKYIDGRFGNYKFNKEDKIYEAFLERALFWINKVENSEEKNILLEKINEIL